MAKLEAKPVFLRVLRETLHIGKACHAARISRTTATNWRNADAAFAEAWDEAVEATNDDLEVVGRQRAIDGSDQLLMFFLRAHRRNTYDERVSVEHSGFVTMAGLAELVTSGTAS